MKTALIGYTGFVGSNILSQFHFDDIYNSKNIQNIRNKTYDLLVNAGVAGTKWIANNNPEEDKLKIDFLKKYLQLVKVDRIVHISTFDVYPNLRGVNEDTLISSDHHNNPYGKNRLHMEKFIGQTFSNYTIIRLPGLYGKNLKKNFIYDFIHNRKLYLTNSENIVQMYNLDHIWHDISIALNHSLKLVHFAVEPLLLRYIVKQVFQVDFINKTNVLPTFYDVRTKHSNIYGSYCPYLYLKKNILQELSAFVQRVKNKV